MPDEQRPPSAPPASPAAGWIQMSSNGPSRSSRPLATQFRATPPARTRFFIPVVLMEIAAQAQHDLLGHGLDAGGEVHVPLLEIAIPACRGGPPNSRWNRRLVIVSPWQ